MIDHSIQLENRRINARFRPETIARHEDHIMDAVYVRCERRRENKMYLLMDGLTGAIVCSYKAKSIALRDCAKKNAPLVPDRRYYVLKPNGSRVTA